MRNRSILSQSIAGGLLATVTDLYWNGALTYFYVKSMGLSLAAASVVMVVFAVFNAVDNLIAGSIADRSRSKLGRRIPFIRACGPLMGLFYCLCFFKLPFLTSQPLIAAKYLIDLCLVDFCVAFLEVSLYSIPYEETLEEAVRGKVFLWQAVFMLLSIGVEVVLVPELQPDSAEGVGLYRAAMCAIGIACGLGIFVCSYFIDSEYRPDADAAQDVNVFRYVIDGLKNKVFLVGEIYSVASVMVYTIFIFGLYYYFDEICTDPLPCYAAAVLGVAAGLVLYFAGIHRASVRFLATVSAVLSGGFLLAGYLVGGTVAGGAIACFGCGMQYVGHMMYSMLMFGEAVDADEVATGLRREGTYNGIDCILASVTNAAQSLFMAILLAYGYVERLPVGTQTEAAKHGIMVGWLVPCILMMALAAVAVALFYPLDQAQAQRNHDILTAKRENAVHE